MPARKPPKKDPDDVVRGYAKRRGRRDSDGEPPIGDEPDIDDGRVDAEALVDADMADPLFIARPWVPEGVTLVVGRPKIGKTTLLRQLAAAANVGGQFFTADCRPARVLFLSLEESERLMRIKLRGMRLAAGTLAGIDLRFEWPRGQYGAERVHQWAERHVRPGEPALVIIDSLARFREPPNAKQNAYTADYEAVNMVATVCKALPGLAALILHHTRKGTTDDPLEAISGTFGLSAACDNYLIVMPEGTRYRLHAGGRLWLGDESDFELDRGRDGWSLAGAWNPTLNALPLKQREALELLNGHALTPKVLTERLGSGSISSTSHLLAQLRGKGLVERIANGWIAVVPASDVKH